MKKWGKTMYRPTRGQMTLFDQPIAFVGAKLSPDNRWVKMAALIPWDLLDSKYSEQFGRNKTGYPAKAARMALGSHIIKEKFGLSDEETVEHIKESPYLQWFIGLPAFTDKAPFDASTMTWFRKRLTPEMLEEVNAYIIGSKKKDDDEDSETGPNSEHGAVEESKNKGTLILDATCAPADIKYPTDVALLNTGREKLERMITELHGQTSQHKKPRTYKRIARKDYLRFARNRRPTTKAIRKAIRQQLGYVRRDLAIIETLLQSGLNLTEKSEGILHIIKTLYSQQEEMYREKKHQVEDRIVSIHQPWVRPIVRGKTNAPTEFGAKIAISMVDGYASVERLDWNAFNETSTLQESVERYYKEHGYYPERILADKIYRTRENLSFCRKHDIRMNGPKLGRPPKDKKAYRLQCLLEKSEAGERNAVEGKFGEGKRAYGLNRIFTRRQDTSETSIHLVFFVMNMEKRLRSLLLPMLEALENMISMLKIIKNRALIGA